MYEDLPEWNVAVAEVIRLEEQLEFIAALPCRPGAYPAYPILIEGAISVINASSRTVARSLNEPHL